MYDVEISYLESVEDLLQEEEKMMVRMFKGIADKYSKEIKSQYKQEIDIPVLPFPRLSFSEAKEILKSLGIDGEKQDDVEFIENIVRILSKYSIHDAGFYPKGILKYKGLTCAGSSMLVSHLFTKRGIEHVYAKPVGHSINIVFLNNKIYWVDAHNGVFDEIKVEIQEYNGFKVGNISSSNPKIFYKLAILLNPTDTFYQILGNMQHFVDIDSEYLTDNEKDLLKKCDLNEINDYIFPDIIKYIKHNPEYLQEKERIQLIM